MFYYYLGENDALLCILIRRRKNGFIRAMHNSFSLVFEGRKSLFLYQFAVMKKSVSHRNNAIAWQSSPAEQKKLIEFFVVASFKNTKQLKLSKMTYSCCVK